MKTFNENLIAEFRANGGTVTGTFAGAPLVLLTMTGAKSGRRITVPLVHTRDGDRVVVIASKGGAPEHPAWYHNLVANPSVTVELPGETFEATAALADEPERTRLYDAQAEAMPNFREYQEKTDRVIPVFVLTRV